MKNHVVSLELAKQLKEAGFKKETEFCFINCYRYDNKYDLVATSLSKFEQGLCIKHSSHYSIKELGYCYPAPIATEMLEEFDSWDNENVIYIFKDCDQYFVQLRKPGFGKIIVDFNDEFLPNTLTKMWLYLRKNNLLESEG